MSFRTIAVGSLGLIVFAGSGCGQSSDSGQGQSPAVSGPSDSVSQGQPTGVLPTTPQNSTVQTNAPTSSGPGSAPGPSVTASATMTGSTPKPPVSPSASTSVTPQGMGGMGGGMNAGGSPELPTPEPTGTSVGGDSNGAGGTGGGPSANPSSSCPIATGDTLAQLLKTRQPVALAKIPDDDFDGGFIVLEGPLWVDDSLYLSQINITTDGVPPPARLMRFNPDAAALEVVATDSGSNGLQRAPDGKVAAARHSDGSIAYITLAANLAPQPIVSQYMGARFDSPNDLVFHPNGTLFFSDPDWQAPNPPPQSVERLYRLAPGGEVQAVDAALNAPTIIQKPNGVAVTHDGATLYVGGKNGLFRFSLDADANVMGTGVELEIAGTELTVANEEEYVDGITIDCAENIYFASNGKIIVLDSQEKYLGEIAVPTPTDPSNIEIGGPNGTTAYITTNQGDTQENNDATAVKPSLYAYDLSMP